MNGIQRTKSSGHTRTRWKWTAIVAAAAMVGASVVVAAAPVGAQGSARGVTDSDITVSGLGTVTSFGGGDKAAKARFDLANKNGEIPGGRKIKYLGFADDKGTPDTNLSEGRRLVDSDRVFAVVPALTVALQSADYFNQQHVPTFGWGVSPNYCATTNKYLFGITGCLTPDSDTYRTNSSPWLLDKIWKSQGIKTGAKGKTWAYLGENTDSGKKGGDAVRAANDSVGMKTVAQLTTVPAPPSVITDFTPYVQQLMTSNNGQPPDVISLALSLPGNLFGMLRSLTNAGYKGLTMTYIYSPLATTPAAGSTVSVQWATPESTSPEMTKIVSTLKTAGIDQPGTPELAGWLSADMFVQILKKVGKNLTPERFQKVASNFKFEVPDVIGPTYYPQGFIAGSPCGELVSSDGTKWTITGQFACADMLKKKGDKYVKIPYPEGVKVNS